MTLVRRKLSSSTRGAAKQSSGAAAELSKELPLPSRERKQQSGHSCLKFASSAALHKAASSVLAYLSPSAHGKTPCACAAKQAGCQITPDVHNSSWHGN